MSSLANQQINLTYGGLLQIPGGLTSTLTTIQDGNGNNFPMSANSSGINMTMTGGSIDGVTIGGTTPSLATFTNAIATGGLYAKGTFGATYSDGIVVDYTTGTGRISVGTSDGLSIYNGGVGGTALLNLDQYGNLGLGVTPSAWGSFNTLQIARSSFSGDTSNLLLSANAYFSSGWKYMGSSQAASQYSQLAGAHTWFTAPSGTAGNAISFTQAMTLDASGNLGIGITSPSSYSTRCASLASGDYAASFVAVSDASATNWARVDWWNQNVAYRGIIYQDQSGLFVIRNDGANAIAFNTNGANERARIDSSGNFLVGKTLTDANNFKIQVSQNTTTYGSGVQIVYAGAGAAAIWENSSGALVFGNDGSSGTTERMRIDSSGNLLVGTTTTVSTNVKGVQLSTDTVGGYIRIGTTSGATNYTVMGFYTASNNAGSITVNGNTTTYATSSDQRLKTNVTPAGSAIQSILDFPVDQFDWISSGEHQDFGAVAQKAINVIPEMVSVPADDDEMWGIDWSKAVPRLIRTVQELHAELQELKATLH
jgi:Chaperone of endosialidase